MMKSEYLLSFIFVWCCIVLGGLSNSFIHLKPNSPALNLLQPLTSIIVRVWLYIGDTRKCIVIFRIYSPSYGPSIASVVI